MKGHLLCGGVAYIGTAIPVLGVESRLEGEDTQHFVTQTTDGMYPTAFPSPYLRRNIIIYLGLGKMLPAELSHPQVEGRIVNEDQGIRLVGEQCLLGDTEITPYLFEVLQHGDEAHKRHIPYVLMQSAPGGFHTVTAESGTLRLRVAPL